MAHKARKIFDDFLAVKAPKEVCAHTLLTKGFTKVQIAGFFTFLEWVYNWYCWFFQKPKGVF